MQRNKHHTQGVVIAKSPPHDSRRSGAGSAGISDQHDTRHATHTYMHAHTHMHAHPHDAIINHQSSHQSSIVALSHRVIFEHHIHARYILPATSSVQDRHPALQPSSPQPPSLSIHSTTTCLSSYTQNSSKIELLKGEEAR